MSWARTTPSDFEGDLPAQDLLLEQIIENTGGQPDRTQMERRRLHRHQKSNNDHQPNTGHDDVRHDPASPLLDPEIANHRNIHDREGTKRTEVLEKGQLIKSVL